MQSSKVVFDFDETFISINSFPYWVVYLIGFDFLTLKWSAGLYLTKCLLQRKIMKTISHVEFKEEILKHKINSTGVRIFCQFLRRYEHQWIRDKFVQHIHQQDEVIISSAAPEIYLREYFINQKIKIVGAHLKTDGTLNDNHSEMKLSNLYHFQWLNKNEKLKEVYTDSYEDLPLAKQSLHVYLIKPNLKTLKAFEILKEHITILK
ncbi:haloacid dehalogenase-like hydrolase [Faecalibacter sp. LW9]|uniref:haloacid dehalogenase-like hydrolase n=1 Tax=Faecalibacter sp. LW9 TaxID=3103144 RepID=UPI002AFED286|nr:haloacid dehalogenase-like hydrolase [Faecalibacter sp. LW9]